MLKDKSSPSREESWDVPLSIRSNSGLEDLIAAGLLSSGRSNSPERKDIEPVIRKAWAAMFDKRTFDIITFFDLQFNNMSEPLLIHPFIEKELYNGTGTFSRTTNGRLKLRIDAVVGYKDRATNPSNDSQKIIFEIFHDDSEKAVVKSKHSSGDSTKQARFDRVFSNFFDAVKNTVESDFLNRKIPPEEIHIEFLVVPDEKNSDSIKPVILQYKPTYSSEIIASIIKGNIPWEWVETFRDISPKDQPARSFSENAHQHEAQPLAELTPDDIADKGRTIMYSLVRYQGNFRIVTWEHIHHLMFITGLFGKNISDFQHLSSGYLNIQDKTLIFSASADWMTYFGDELGLSKSLLKNAFLKAFSNETRETHPVHLLLSDGKLQFVEFRCDDLSIDPNAFDRIPLIETKSQ